MVWLDSHGRGEEPLKCKGEVSSSTSTVPVRLSLPQSAHRNKESAWLSYQDGGKKGRENGQIFLTIIGPSKITAFKPWTIGRWEEIWLETIEQIHQDNNRSEIMAGVSEEEWVRPAGFFPKPCHQFATSPWTSSFLCFCCKFLICRPVSTWLGNAWVCRCKNITWSKYCCHLSTPGSTFL